MSERDAGSRDPGEMTMDEQEIEAHVAEIRAGIRKDLVTILSRASEALGFLEAQADVLAAIRVKELIRTVDHLARRSASGNGSK